MSRIFDPGPSDPNTNRGPQLVQVCVAMMCVSLIGVCGRFVARKLIKQTILWDDWMIIPALLFSWGCCIIQILGVYYACFGRHAQFATPKTTIIYFKLLYALDIIYPFAIAFIKFSIILFYRRIFSVPQTKKPLLALGIIVGAWCIGVVMAAIPSCIPIETFWTHKEPRTCIDPLRYFLGVAIPNVATDVVLLAFPIPWIWKLVISTSQKIALLAIFLIAGFVIIISSMRMVTVIQTQHHLDYTMSLIPLAIWNVVETNVGVLLACLPSMRPLLKVLLGQKLDTRLSKKSTKESSRGLTKESKV